MREALAKAVVDARQNAEVIAKAAGAKLGTARTINANTEFTPPPMPMVRAMAMEAKAARRSAVSERRDDVQRDGASSVRPDPRSERCYEHSCESRRAGALAALWLAACAAHAIEVPKPQPAPEQPPEAAAAAVTVTPTDERAFYEKVQRVTAYRVDARTENPCRA